MPESYIDNVIFLDPETGLSDKGAVWLKRGKIEAMGKHVIPPKGADIIDGGGHYLVPGFVDMRVQLCTAGTQSRDMISAGIEVALRGGVTSMVMWSSMACMIDDIAGVEFLARRGREAKGTKLYCYAALTKGLKGIELTEFGLLKEAGALGFTDGEYALDDTQLMHWALTYGAGLDVLIIQHPEMRALTEDGQMNKGLVSTLLGLKGMPSYAEAMMVERDIRLLREVGGRYHVAHVSTKEAVDVIRKAKAEGLKITCDTAPQYFLLNDLAVQDYRTFAKVNPPLRSEEDRLAIIEGLKDDTIDAISSDHLPQGQDSKRQPFEWASFGMVGLETLFALSLKLVHNGDLTFTQMLKKLTCNPADILKLEAGRLQIGMQADLALVDKNHAWLISEENLHPKARNTSFEKMPVEGKVLKCWVDGRVMGA